MTGPQWWTGPLRAVALFAFALVCMSLGALGSAVAQRRLAGGTGFAAAGGAANPVVSPLPARPPVPAEMPPVVPAASPIVRLQAREVPLEVPEDPFVPAHGEAARAEPSPAPSARAASPAAPLAAERSQSPQSPRSAPPPGPGLAIPARPTDLTLVGIVQGDPPLAVFQAGQETLYLKIGDPVSGGWRLESIHERSVVMKLGEHRVEVPIRGGSHP